MRVTQAFMLGLSRVLVDVDFSILSRFFEVVVRLSYMRLIEVVVGLGGF